MTSHSLASPQQHHHENERERQEERRQTTGVHTTSSGHQQHLWESKYTLLQLLCPLSWPCWGDPAIGIPSLWALGYPSHPGTARPLLGTLRHRLEEELGVLLLPSSVRCSRGPQLLPILHFLEHQVLCGCWVLPQTSSTKSSLWSFNSVETLQ